MRPYFSLSSSPLAHVYCVLFSPVSLRQFQLLRSIGRGAFGKVDCSFIIFVFSPLLLLLSLPFPDSLFPLFEYFFNFFPLSTIILQVRIVQKRDDKKLYALKYINKEKCIKMKAVQNVIQERQLLEQIKHPLIVNLQFAFQDDENMFM